MKKKHLIVVTGASRGIGNAIAERLRNEGYSILNLSRTASSLAEINQLQVDLAHPDFIQVVDEWVKQHRSLFTQVSLIHNAALMKKDSVETLAADSFQEVLQVNLVAPQKLNQLLRPLMKKGSAIIYLGSTLSEKAVSNSFSYVTSKHAVVGMMRATVQDLLQTGIHSVCVCPGFTDTEMLRTHLGSEAILTKVKSKMGLEARLVCPEEIATTVQFCLENPVLNGSVIHANLGQRES